MFPDRLTLFSHPAILIMLAVMTAMFILEFVFRKRFFIIVNAAFAAFFCNLQMPKENAEGQICPPVFPERRKF